jgi:bacillolysin
MLTRPRSLAVPLLLSTCAAVSACSSSTPDVADLGGRLEADTGVSWTVYADPETQAVRFIGPDRPVKIGEGDAEAVTRAFFARYHDALAVEGDPDDLRLTVATDEEDGGRYVRFEHYLHGTDVRVFDAVSTARFTKDGEVVWMQSGFRDLGEAPRTAEVSESDAIGAADAAFQERCGEPLRRHGDPVATLGLVEDAEHALVWRVQLMDVTARCTTPLVTIDATSGAAVSVDDVVTHLQDRAKGVRAEAFGDASDVKTIDVTSAFAPFVPLPYKYSMETTSFPTVRTHSYNAHFFNTIIRTNTLGEWDSSSAARGAAVDAHYNVTRALAYFKVHHKRNSTTGFGNAVNVVVHRPFKNAEGGVYHENASMQSSAWIINEMKCGDGNYLSGGEWLPPCSALDITAHEIAHGVMHYTSGLEYEGQSGALNESFSDVMGAAAENIEAPDTLRNFLIGERALKRGNLRNMLEPKKSGGGAQPDHMDGFESCEQRAADHCGVHRNSGIPNRAFSLMTVGGVHQHSKVGVPKGLDWKMARELWYDTFTKLGPRADFRTAAEAQVREALTKGPEALQAVACAWYAVGVFAELPRAAAQIVCGAPTEKAALAPAPAKGPGCTGRASGHVCSENVPNTALRCDNGNVVDALYCKDSKTKCKKAGADDWTASVHPDGSLVCE